jgi:hypothetical protein
MIFTDIVVEDVLQEVVVRKILSGYTQITINSVFGLHGAGYIDSKIVGFNQAAKINPYIILRDLDNAECAPRLRMQLIGENISDQLLFCIIVREVETWLLSDSQSFCSFLGIPLPTELSRPEMIDSPKEFLFSLAAKSRKREIRDGIIPRGTARTGAMYNFILIKYVEKHWNWKNASIKSSSLKRFINRLSAFIINLERMQNKSEGSTIC